MKLTYKEVVTLLGYTKPHRLQQLTCNFFGEERSHIMVVRAEIRWPLYILLLPFASLFQIICLLWDGGLREFSFEPRCISLNEVWHESSRYKAFKEMRGQ